MRFSSNISQRWDTSEPLDACALFFTWNPVQSLMIRPTNVISLDILVIKQHIASTTRKRGRLLSHITLTGKNLMLHMMVQVHHGHLIMTLCLHLLISTLTCLQGMMQIFCMKTIQVAHLLSFILQQMILSLSTRITQHQPVRSNTLQRLSLNIRIC